MARTLAGAATLDAAQTNESATASVSSLLDRAGLDQAVVDQAVFDQAGLDQAGLDRDLDAPASPDWDAAIARYRAGTAAARTQLAPGTLRYGGRAREALDIYAPAYVTEDAQAAPVVIFIHGGGWRTLSKDESGFAAPAFVGAGVVFVALDMTPLPECTLAELLSQARRAIKWLHAQIAAHGGDPARLHLCGHGSGAHVAAMLAGTNWRH